MENKTNLNEFSPEASLKVIYDMINSAKSKIGRNYFYYLFWGYLVAFTAVLEYVLIRFVDYPKHSLIWPVLMVSGTVVTLIFSYYNNKERASKSFISSAFRFLWSGWFISFSILLFFLIKNGDHMLLIPVIMSMYGLAIFISGGIVSFRPLLIGAVVSWIVSIIAFFVSYPLQLILLTITVVIAYIIPGYILKNKSKA